MSVPTKPVSLRMPIDMLDALKASAAKARVGWQTLALLLIKGGLRDLEDAETIEVPEGTRMKRTAPPAAPAVEPEAVEPEPAKPAQKPILSEDDMDDIFSNLG